MDDVIEIKQPSKYAGHNMTNTIAPIYRKPLPPRDFKVAPLGTESRRERRKAWRDGPMKEGTNFRSSGFCVQPRLTAEVI